MNEICYLGNVTIPHMTTQELTRIAYELRILVIKMLLAAKSGHTAGPLGMAEIFAVLYFDSVIKQDPHDPLAANRDRIILSNGHICPIRYAAMAKAGFFPEAELLTFRAINSRLQGHPSRVDLPMIETSSGPLGQGISQAVGMALALQRDAKPQHVYVLISDGECDEGQTWEALMFAGNHQLSHLTAIIDRNDIQISGKTSAVMSLEPLKEKLISFNWDVVEIDGHDIAAITEALHKGKRQKAKPLAIIAKTVPGKGVSFMENDFHWHGKPPNPAEGERALKELSKVLETL